MTMLLQDLNPQQREAVLYDDGGALILAGAGTGKTRVLTSKVIHLLTEKQVNPAHILAVTFTNKAAQEMKSRIEAALPPPPRSLQLGTFHSICHRLLRIHAQTAGLDKNFQILDSQDQLTFIRRLFRENEINDKDFPPQELRSYVSIAKENGWRAAEAPVDGERSRQMARLYQLYEAACRREHKLDFAELMLAVMELWRDHREIRQHYAERFRYILVDELQDTNRQQFDWLRMLDSGSNHYFAVGDDDQSIYAFRGAEPAIMQEFQSRLRADKLIRLEENYRSVKNILDVANQLISHNRNRLGKTLVTAAETGATISILPADSDELEAKGVAQLLKYYVDRGGEPNEAAVLYRTNAQVRLFERELMYYGVPYRVYGGLRFYDWQEVKHALAYLRLAVSDDRDALLRVINMPPRGIGDKALAELTGAGELFDNVAQSTHRRVAAFNALLRDLRGWQAGTLADKVRAALEHSGLPDYYKQRNEDERAENLGELVNAAAQFEANFTGEDNADGEVLTAFLSTVALEAGGEHETSERQAVNLMTIHAAKGLEFKRVFIVGMEEGLFPHAESLSAADSRQLEDERRLLYVAITRARQELSLHFARSRLRYGQLNYNPSSRFLEELPAECLSDQNWHLPVRSAASAARRHGGMMGRRHPAASSVPADIPPPRKRESLGKIGKSDGFRIGDGVRHGRYGIGVIMSREGDGEDEVVEIFFKQDGKKRFKTALAPLEKL